MTKKDIALNILDKLFELSEKDLTVRIGGHCSDMIISWGAGDGSHHHIDTITSNYKEQLTEINNTLRMILKEHE